jgi:hypothetical protein
LLLDGLKAADVSKKREKKKGKKKEKLPMKWRGRHAFRCFYCLL